MERICGVYGILNRHNGKLYVGSASHCIQRYKNHVRLLDKGRHHSIKLQRAWDKHDPEVWSWVILEQCLVGQLLEREQYWLDHFQSYLVGYNVSQVADSPMRGRHHTPESRSKCVIASAKLDRRDPAYRAKLSAALSGENNPMYGKVVSPEHRERISKANTGKKHTEETKRKMSQTATVTQQGEKNGFFGKKHTEETKAKLAAALHTPEAEAKNKASLAKRRGKTWEELYGLEIATRMRNTVIESNKRRANNVSNHICECHEGSE